MYIDSIHHILVPVNERFEEDKIQVIREISILESSDPSSSETENGEVEC